MSVKRKIGVALGRIAVETLTEAAKSFASTYGMHAANAVAAKRWPDTSSTPAKDPDTP